MSKLCSISSCLPVLDSHPFQFAQSCLTLCDPMTCSMPGFPVHHQLPELVQAQVHRVGDAIQPSHPLSSSSPAFDLSQPISIFSNELVFCIWWPKYWSFNFSISPSNEYSGLISFRMDWLDTLAVQGTLKILLQHHSSKASILRHSAFFVVQLSHPYMTTGKTIALTRWTILPLFSRHLWRVCTPCLQSVMYRQPNMMLRIWTPTSSVLFHHFLAWSLIFLAVR